MSYLISLDLPLWVSFIPLAIALYLASKKYKWKAKYYAAKHEAQTELLTVKDNLQKRFDDFIEVSDRIIERNDKQIAKDAESINKLKTEAAEREALIVQLNSNIEAHLSHIDELIETIGNLDYSNKELKETNGSLIGKFVSKNLEIERLQTDLNAAIAIMNRTIRGRKQWGKYEAANKSKLKGQVKTIIDDCRIEGIVYDSVGVPRIVKADQSENDNGRHDVLAICDEVNRGVKEQAELIKKELASVVDMSQLEVGDSVVLRNGIIKKVNECGKIDNDANYHTYISVDYTEGENWIFKSFIDYKQNGSYWHGKSSSPYDIVQIIKSDV